MTAKSKNSFWIIATVSLFVLAFLTTTGDILENSNIDNGFVGLLLLPSTPGFLIYVLLTGDIHGWQPGPIGQAGRIIVSTIGAWIFWTPLIYWIYKKRLRNKQS